MCTCEHTGESVFARAHVCVRSVRTHADVPTTSVIRALFVDSKTVYLWGVVVRGLHGNEVGVEV